MLSHSSILYSRLDFSCSTRCIFSLLPFLSTSKYLLFCLTFSTPRSIHRSVTAPQFYTETRSQFLVSLALITAWNSVNLAIFYYPTSCSYRIRTSLIFFSSLHINLNELISFTRANQTATRCIMIKWYINQVRSPSCDAATSDARATPAAVN